MKIRHANETDSQDIFDWRNDPLTRAASLNTGEIDREAHQLWFSSALKNESLVMYLGHADDSSEALGMCRFDIDFGSNSAEVSINLNPKFRGKGLGKTLLTASIAKFVEDTHGLKSLTATVKEDNVSSVRLFRNAGFELVSAGENPLKFELSLQP